MDGSTEDAGSLSVAVVERTTEVATAAVTAGAGAGIGADADVDEVDADAAAAAALEVDAGVAGTGLVACRLVVLRLAMSSVVLLQLLFVVGKSDVGAGQHAPPAAAAIGAGGML